MKKQSRLSIRIIFLFSIILIILIIASIRANTDEPNVSYSGISVNLDSPKSNTQSYTTKLSQMDKDFWTKVKKSIKGGILNISYESIYVTIRPYFVKNGINYTWAEVKGFYPEVGINISKIDREYDTKWGVNISNPLNRSFDYIALRVEDIEGLTWDDVKKERQRIIIKDKLVFDYSDVIKQGFNLSMFDNRTVRIGGVNGLTIINIDPIVSYYPNSSGAVGWREGRLTPTTLWAWDEVDATVYTAGELNTISTDNETSVSTIIGDNNAIMGHRLRFNISEDVSTITNITILAKHSSFHDFSNNALDLYIGNASNKTWVQIANKTSPTNNLKYNQSGTISTPHNISDFINETASSKFVYVLLFSKGTTLVEAPYHDNFFVQLNVTVDNIVPTTPTITYPINGNNYTDIPYINYSSTDADGDAITYKIYINGTLNISTTVNVTDWNASDGYYNLTVSAWDGNDSSANSTYIKFALDVTPPNVNITYPINNSNISSNAITINATASDNIAPSLTYYWFINGTLNSTSLNSNSTFNASDGYYNLTLFVSDSLQNGTNTSLFTLDTTAPSITNLNNKTIDDGTDIFYTNDNIYFNATIIDTTLTKHTITLSWNDTSNVWHNETPANIGDVYYWVINTTNISIANNKWLAWRYYANDTAGNMQIGSIVHYFVNNLPPELESPAGAGGGSEGARGGGCDVYADAYKTCYYINENNECTVGCLDGYVCNDIYRCVIEEGGFIETKEKVKKDLMRVIIVSILSLSLIVGLLVELELKMKKIRGKEVEKLIK